MTLYKTAFNHLLSLTICATTSYFYFDFDLELLSLLSYIIHFCSVLDLPPEYEANEMCMFTSAIFHTFQSFSLKVFIQNNPVINKLSNTAISISDQECYLPKIKI